MLAVFLLARGRMARAEDVARRPNEADEAFVARVVGTPAEELAHPVVRSTELAGGKAALIAFVEAEEELVGHLLVERAPLRFEHVTFPSCEVEGGSAKILAVFFARTARDRARDLGVLCEWDEHHPYADVDGAFYEARFYRVSDEANRLGVRPLPEIDKRFKTSDLERNHHGRWVRETRPAFTTVAEVKRRLSRMGIKP